MYTAHDSVSYTGVSNMRQNNLHCVLQCQDTLSRLWPWGIREIREPEILEINTTQKPGFGSTPKALSRALSSRTPASGHAAGMACLPSMRLLACMLPDQHNDTPWVKNRASSPWPSTVAQHTSSHLGPLHGIPACLLPTWHSDVFQNGLS